MQAIILTAGKGTRMHPLTLERPKPLVLLKGRPILEHIVNALPESIDEVILVVGYKGDMIIEHCGDEFHGRKMQYVWQHEQLGTAHALAQAKDVLHDSFLLLYGDDLIDSESIARALAHRSSVLAFEHENPSAFGVIVPREDGTVETIVEKPKDPPSNLVCAAGLVLNEDLFSYYEAQPKDKEYYVTDVLGPYVKENPVHVARVNFWQPVNSIEQLAEAEAALD